MTPMVDNGFVQTYIENNKTLARTLIIKSEASELGINTDLRNTYGQNAVDAQDKSTFKYYLNLAGEYHFSDQLMTITSLDTLEKIIFNKENLLSHAETAQAYQFGSRYYYSLVNQFPKQEPLIFGILYPVDIQRAIEAEDGTILGYPSYLVEPQEQSLISELQVFVSNYLKRWNVQAFGLTDTLYNTSYHALLYLNLFPKLINLRLKRCHTQEAHSFHIKEFLASHGRLDRFLPYLTLEQALWLYRNVRKIKIQVGRSKTFSSVIEHVLSKRKIPISEYSIRHVNELDDEYYPIVRARMKPINPVYNNTEVSYSDLELLFKKEQLIQEDNKSYLEHYASDIERVLKNTTSSVTQTKVLESDLIDYTDAVADPINKIRLREWISLASQGLYNAIVNFKDPKDGLAYSLNALDAYIYMQYLIFSRIGLRLDNVPVMFVAKRRKKIKPTLQYLMSLTEPSVREDLLQKVKQILDNQPVVRKLSSIKSFASYTNVLFDQGLEHLKLLGMTVDFDAHASLRNAIYGLYEDTSVVAVDKPILYENWLSERNLPTYNYSDTQAKELIKIIFESATGTFDDPFKKLSNIQRELTNLVKELTSYTIQIIATINDSAIVPLYPCPLSLARFKTSTQALENVTNGVQVLETQLYHNKRVSAQVQAQSFNSIVSSIQSKEVAVDNQLQQTSVESRSFNYSIALDNHYITANYAGRQQDLSARAGYVGVEFFNALSLDQKSQLMSIY